MSAPRHYELVLLGATGYTGKLCAEYVAKHLPTDLRWAVAGRNSEKLAKVAEHLKKLSPDRKQPDVEVVELKREELDALAAKTVVLITTVGPYMKCGEPVFEACAKNGTHYLDCTGEVTWLREMIEKYHEKAKSSGAIMIPQCGIDSVPADVLAFIIATEIKRRCPNGTAEIVNSLVHMNIKPSGGTLGTFLTLFDHYPIQQIRESVKPYALSPIPAPAQATKPRQSFMSRLLGIRHVPELGYLTDWIQASVDTCIVHRSWGLLDEGRLYGSNFRFSEWKLASNALHAAIVHLVMTIGGLMVLLRPVRWILRRILMQPGQGPDMESTKNDSLHYRALGIPAPPPSGPTPPNLKASFAYNGNGYYLTGLLMAEAAMILLRGDPTTMAHKLGGGVLTPATLGDTYVQRLKDAGLKIEVEDQKE